jgi:hypothetical protein
MPTEQRPSSLEEKANRYPLALTVLSGLSFVALLLLLYFVGSSFETLEDQLRYKQTAPVSQDTAGGSYGIDIVEGQTVYVPVYSHIYADGGKPHLLEATLSIHTLDPTHGITVKSARYFDTAGKLLKDYLDKELQLGPLETAVILVEKRDISGGVGANFFVVWDSQEPVYEPLIEAVMVGFSDRGSISFARPGRALIERAR